MIKHIGKRVIAVEKMVDEKDTASPGSKERTVLMACMEKAVGNERIAIIIKESTNACLNLILLPI